MGIVIIVVEIIILFICLGILALVLIRAYRDSRKKQENQDMLLRKMLEERYYAKTVLSPQTDSAYELYEHPSSSNRRMAVKTNSNGILLRVTQVGVSSALNYDLNVMENIYIGRGWENNVILADPNVSSRHCRLIPRNGCVFVQDLDSTNGTWIVQKGKRVRAASDELTPLENEDILRLGMTDLIVQYANA